jgi:very-short-patch-repair endonuclease
LSEGYDTDNNPITKAAKELRQRQTDAERRLWFKLRDKQTCGIKFRRQEPIGSFIVDFVNYEKKLIIEIDGNPHRETKTRINDNYRTQWLQSQDYKVLRFWNAEIVDDIEKVVSKIKSYLE